MIKTAEKAAARKPQRVELSRSMKRIAQIWAREQCRKRRCYSRIADLHVDNV